MHLLFQNLKCYESELNELYLKLSSTDKAKVTTNNTMEDIVNVLMGLADSSKEDQEYKKLIVSFIHKVIVFDDYLESNGNPYKK